jgi:hypothetical protein
VTLSSSKRQRSDKEKNLTAEAVLGLRSDLLSSTLNEAHAQLVSGYPAFPLLPLYSSAPSACPFTQLRSKFSWHAGSDCATLEVRSHSCVCVDLQDDTVSATALRAHGGGAHNTK